VTRLQYVSNATVDFLRENIDRHHLRYTKDGFFNLPGEWNIDLRVDVDLAPLGDLDPATGADTEVKNSELVWRTFHNINLLPSWGARQLQLFYFVQYRDLACGSLCGSGAQRCRTRCEPAEPARACQFVMKSSMLQPVPC
jgi:hypothetical protein